MKYCKNIFLLVALTTSNASAFHKKLRGSKYASSYALDSRSAGSSSFSPQRNLRSLHSTCKLLSSKSVIETMDSFAKQISDATDSVDVLTDIHDETCIKEVHRAYKNELKAALSRVEGEKQASRIS